MARDWSAYFQASLDKPLNPLWDQIDPLLKSGQMAIDLGCGVGNGTLHLLEKGLSVVAIDQEAEALDFLRTRVPKDAQVRLIQSTFQKLPLEPASYDLAVAFFTLFFLGGDDFNAFWPRLIESIKPNGVFGGQLLGMHDDWAGDPCYAVTKGELDRLLAPFDVLYLEEADRDGETLLKEPKHWHVFHIVARRR